MRQRFTIQHLNSSGEGVAFNEGDETILIPFTLPGEVVEATVPPAAKRGEVRRGTLDAIIHPSPSRQVPPCQYFGLCGGCQLQHLEAAFYKDYKKNLVHEAFASHKLEGSLLEPVVFGPGVRRRINFKAVKHQGNLLLGFHRRRSHEVLDIDDCPLLLPVFNALLDPLKTALSGCLKEGEKANVFLTKVNNGFDGAIVFEEQRSLSTRETSLLTNWAMAHQVVRLMVKFPKDEDLIVHQVAPTVLFSDIPVLFPSHAFLQTSEDAEAYMVRTVLSLLPKSTKRIADLFAGLGTFSFPLVQKGNVDAFEGDMKAVQYLNLSAQQHPLPHALRGSQRDLFKYPLSREEINTYDAVVLDPPRAGAVQQIKQLMGSSVRTIIMVSCNANTFARDAQLLVKGGYMMKETHLIDQFLWSPHIELISSFERG